MHSHLRTVRLSPYLRGMGPSFTLRLSDTGRTDSSGRSILAYTLRQSGKRRPIFDGADYSPGHCTAIDSDDAVAGLLSFLTLREGDTDADYFAGYTPEQIEFRAMHAEALAMASLDRFGER